MRAPVAQTVRPLRNIMRLLLPCCLAIAFGSLVACLAQAQNPTPQINNFIQGHTTAPSSVSREQSTSLTARCRAYEQRSKSDAQIYRDYRCESVPHIKTTQWWPDTRGLYDRCLNTLGQGISLGNATHTEILKYCLAARGAAWPPPGYGTIDDPMPPKPPFQPQPPKPPAPPQTPVPPNKIDIDCGSAAAWSGLGHPDISGGSYLTWQRIITIAADTANVALPKQSLTAEII